MNDKTEQVEATEEVTHKTVIRPDIARYVRDKSGNGKRTHRTDDFIARTLAGKNIDEIKAGAEKLDIDFEKWNHLNIGQQRMLIGNKLRHLMQLTKDPLTEDRVTEVYGEPVAEYDEEAEAAAKAAAAAKAEDQKEEAPTTRKRNASKPVKAQAQPEA
jgi:hypothetical protein